MNDLIQFINKRRWALVAFAAAAALAVAASAMAAIDGQSGFGFNASEISGFPAGAVFLTGGGAFNPVAGSFTLGAASAARATSARARWPSVSAAKAFAGTRSNSAVARPSSAPGQRRSP